MLITIPDVLNAREILEIKRLLEKHQFVSGTATGKATLKNNLQANPQAPEVQRALQGVLNGLMRKDEFTAFAIPHNVQLMFNRYDPGMTYKDHIDAALMGPSQRQALRSDLSVTVHLTDPKTYAGGDFVIQTPYGEQRVRGGLGSAIVYPSSMLHRVEPIIGGSRISCVGWIQSFVRDTEDRLLIWELDKLRHDLAAAHPESEFPERFGQIHQNLLRKWVEV